VAYSRAIASKVNPAPFAKASGMVRLAGKHRRNDWGTPWSICPVEPTSKTVQLVTANAALQPRSALRASDASA
jgi:hypothetical protein